MSNELAEVSTLYALRFTRKFAHPVERVWRAITDDSELEAWMGYPARLDLRVGGEVALCGDDESGAITGIVTKLEPPHVLRYTWDPARMTEFGPGWQAFVECLERYLDGQGLAPDEQRRMRVTELEAAYRTLIAARH